MIRPETARVIESDELADLHAALKVANADLKELDQKYRDALRRERDRNPEPDETLRPVLSIPVGECSLHERPYAERELFDAKIREHVESCQRKNYILRVQLCNFTAIPVRAKGCIGVDREWTADLILGSVREFGWGTVQASFNVEVI